MSSKDQNGKEKPKKFWNFFWKDNENGGKPMEESEETNKNGGKSPVITVNSSNSVSSTKQVPKKTNSSPLVASAPTSSSSFNVKDNAKDNSKGNLSPSISSNKGNVNNSSGGSSGAPSKRTSAKDIAFASPKESGNKTPENASVNNNIIRAKQVINEIEAIIQKELALMSAEDLTSEKLEGQETPSPIKKRPGPKLIRPVNKKKNKMVMGEMEFDPVRNIWVGNEEDLDVFHRAAPALISNMNNQSNQVQVIGDMTFDPVERVWRGNEKDLKKFNGNIGLISQIKPTSEPIVKDGMTFDPETMTWVGNDDATDIFDQIDDLEPHRSFNVEDEFVMSPELIKSFKEYEDEHKSFGGWLMADSDKTGRTHLNDIRGMSIMRIVHQAKHSGIVVNVVSSSSSPTSVNSISHIGPSNLLSPKLESPGITRLSRKIDMPNSIPLSSSPKPSILIPDIFKPPKGEEDDDWDEFDLPVSANMKRIISTSRGKSNSDNEVSELDLSDSGNETLKTPHGENSDKPTPPGSLNQYRDEEDEFDDLEIDSSTISKKISRTNSTGSLSSQFSLSSGVYPTARAKKDNSKVDFSEDDDDDDDLDFSQGIDLNSQRAKQLLPSGTSTMGRKLGNFILANQSADFSDGEGEVEEWSSDIELPTSGKLSLVKKMKTIGPITTKSPTKKASKVVSEDEWSEIDFPEKPLMIKSRPRQASSSDEGNEDGSDEEWSDLEIPTDFANRLNVNQPPSNPFGTLKKKQSRATILKGHT
eukprot:TRINITY_DN6362_c0_g1_i1.p1 TRINITY_DN6362_c0_g1~~TRINITY_DN6362_c0_g1_i1.p1  ORF type:complete len:796 (+),score=352.81 TRINITY_DN6362_c0_g1_i1:121-2388(+)